MQQQTTGFAEALSNIRNVADQIGARGFIDLSDDLRIAAVTLDAAPALYAALDGLLELCQHANRGAFANGNTDATGSIDEGEVYASRFMDDARAALRAFNGEE